MNAVACFLPEGSRDRELEPGPDQIETGIRLAAFTTAQDGRIVRADGDPEPILPTRPGPDARQRALVALRAEVRAARPSGVPAPARANVTPLPPEAPEPICPFPE